MTKNLSEQARDIHQRLLGLCRDIYLEENPEQKKYNIGILGVGDLGLHIAEAIIKEEKKVDFLHRIGNIYLVGRNPRRQWAVEREFGASGDHRPFEKEHTDNLENIVHKLDIVFLAYDATPHRKKRMETEAPSRDESTLWNLALTLQLANHFKQDFAGNVIIASNLTDTLAQAFAYRAGMDSRRVIGLNQVDSGRFKYEIIQRLQRDKLLEPGINPGQLDIRAVTAGTHNSPFGIHDGVYAGGLKVTDFPERTRNDLNRILRDFGKKQVKEGITTSPSTAAAAVDTMLAIMDGQSMVTASIPFDYGDKCIYIGLPVKFQDGHAQDLEHWTRKAVLDENFGHAVKWLQKTPERLRKLITGSAIQHIETQEELIEREEELLSAVDELEKAYKKFKPKKLDHSVDGLRKKIGERKEGHSSSLEGRINLIKRKVKINLFAYTSGGSTVFKYEVLDGDEPVCSFPCEKQKVRAIAVDETNLGVVVEGRTILFDAESGEPVSKFNIKDQPIIQPTEKELSALVKGNIFVCTKGDNVAIRHYSPDFSGPKNYRKRKDLGDCTHIETAEDLTPYASIGNEIFSWRKEDKTGTRRYAAPSGSNIRQFRVVDKGEGHYYILFTRQDDNKVYLDSTDNSGELLSEFNADNGIFDFGEEQYLCTLEDGKFKIRKYSRLDMDKGPIGSPVESEERFDNIEYIRARKGVLVAVTSTNRVHIVDIESGDTIKRDFSPRGNVSTRYSRVVIENVKMGS